MYDKFNYCILCKYIIMFLPRTRMFFLCLLALQANDSVYCCCRLFFSTKNDFNSSAPGLSIPFASLVVVKALRIFMFVAKTVLFPNGNSSWSNSVTM